MPGTAFQSKYSPQERAAVVAAWDRGIRPKTLIARMAAAGELSLHGVQIPPFEVRYETARGWIIAEEKRRKARVQTSSEDQLEQLRGQLLDVARIGVADLEKKQRKGQPDWELMRQAARALREIKAIPPKDERAVKPGGHNPNTGKTEDGATTGGLAGAILTAARRTPDQEQPEAERITRQEALAENGNGGATTGNGTHNAEEDGEHGALGAPKPSARASRSTLLRS